MGGCMKKIFLLCLVFSVLLPFVSCEKTIIDDTTVNDETTTPEETTSGNNSVTQPIYATESFKITSETPLDEVTKLVEEYKSLPLLDLTPISKTTSYNKIPSNYEGSDGNQFPLLYLYSQYLPIWYIKKIDNDHLYIVYRVRDEDSASTFRYLFFEKDKYSWKLYGEGYEIPITGVKSYQIFSGMKSGDNLSDHLSKLYGNIQYSAAPTTNFARGEAYVPLMEGLLYVSFSSEKDYNQWKTDSYPKDCFTITQVTFIPYGTQDVSYFNGQKIAITKIDGGPIFPNDVEAYY